MKDNNIKEKNRYDISHIFLKTNTLTALHKSMIYFRKLSGKVHPAKLSGFM